jgi:16S rRNA pseudouridine516 synthase
MRLDKYVGGSSTLSRKEAVKAIRRGRVTVDSVKQQDSSSKVDEHKAVVTLDDEELLYREQIYIMLNKPDDYICSTKDGRNKIILELLPPLFAQREPFACGRLDIDTTGLVILTDDGRWSHNITSPKKKCFKTYIVNSLFDLSSDAMQELEAGVMLDDDDKITLPAKIKELASCKYELQIQEGRFHQVKRMFTAVGNSVVKLHRHGIGPVVLDEGLEPGNWRELSESEIKAFKK